MIGRTWWTAAAVVALVALGGYAVARGRGWQLRGPAAQAPATPLPAIQATGGVIADARVVPARRAALSFGGSGAVRSVDVEEGDVVPAGRVLVRLESARQASIVLQAEADLVAAAANLRKVERGADAESIAAAEAAVDVARADVQAAAARIASAAANLRRVAGGSPDDAALAERRVALAKNVLWGAQAQRDSICGRVEDGVADQADCDGARSRVAQAEEEVRIAELEQGRATRGGEADDVAAARATVGEAESARSAAEARVRQAEAELARVTQGADTDDLAAARAALDQADARLEQARVALDDQALRAPFAGMIGAIDVREGEHVAPGVPVLQIGDLAAWRVETEDLTELDIVDIEEGAPVVMTFDAIDGLEMAGKVDRIRTFGENRLGDITYRVTIVPAENDPRLRWNMTAQVRIGP